MAEYGCLKDGHFNNLQVENSVIVKKNFKSINASGQTITKNDCGIIFINGSDSAPNASLACALHVTLPEAETGLHYKFIVNASFTAGPNSASFTIAATDTGAKFVGQINSSGTPTLIAPSSRIILSSGGATKVRQGGFIDFNCFVGTEDDETPIKTWHTSGQLFHTDGITLEQ